jgi:hypothetical protein
LVKLLTSTGGRRARGRVFLPWLRANVTNGGLLNTPDKDDTTAGWEAFRAGINAYDANYHFVVASYRGLTTHNVTSAVCEQATGTQRRRQQRIRG